MDAKAIIDQIGEDAKSAAADLLNEARKKADALRAACRQRLDARAEEIDRRIVQDAKEQEARLVRMAELEEKKQFLTAKRAVLDRAFEQAVAVLRALPDGEARAFFLRRLTALAEGDETLLPGRDGPQLFDGAFLAEANAALMQAGKKGQLTLSGERTAGSGFVLRKGGAEINCTFEALVDAMRLESETDAAQILFP